MTVRDMKGLTSKLNKIFIKSINFFYFLLQNAINLDLGQDESGHKTIGITFPNSTGKIERASSLALSNRTCWNKPNRPRKWWVTPLRIGISFFSLFKQIPFPPLPTSQPQPGPTSSY